MGTGQAARERRIAYQWSFKRQKRDDRNINLMIAKAERSAAGEVPMRKARFLKVTGAAKELDQATIDRARQLAGLKGYVTNLDPETLPAAAVIAAYHHLWQVEASFRMTKSEVAPQGITVNAIAPGLILETPFHETFTPPADQEKTIASTPVGQA
ncbi:hypothetical protein EXU48_09970 [Occultella glacieicola]|uniref:SDR family oxidoreductase n=1 Tax=Occultella glacieicola TaxID=2518684 RepID=A0ABY2E5J5_9MICO|nr:hypothetical protein [Occultella glacieicola]TDE95078.1 hypothetical protein EXU48_09970 [Occultella glacieicola]